MSGLPVDIDPIKLAERGSHLTGTLPLRGMPRLTEFCLDDRGEVEVDLEFGRREQDNRPGMTGRLSTRLRVTCPRCLESVELRLEANPDVVLLKSDEGVLDEPDGPDSMVIGQTVELNHLVEDELLLALPMSPAHPEGRCPTGSANGPADQGKRINPFAVLEALKGGPEKRKR